MPRKSQLKPQGQKIYKVTTENKDSVSTSFFKKNAQKRDLTSGQLVEFDARPTLHKKLTRFLL